MKWISVKDRLPECDTNCLVCNEARPFNYYVSSYIKYFDEFEVWMIGMSQLTEGISFKATHWMRIEPLPKDKS